jgi:hypothetical protein
MERYSSERELRKRAARERYSSARELRKRAVTEHCSLAQALHTRALPGHCSLAQELHTRAQSGHCSLAQELHRRALRGLHRMTPGHCRCLLAHQWAIHMNQKLRTKVLVPGKTAQRERCRRAPRERRSEERADGWGAS